MSAASGAGLWASDAGWAEQLAALDAPTGARLWSSGIWAEALAAGERFLYVGGGDAVYALVLSLLERD